MREVYTIGMSTPEFKLMSTVGYEGIGRHAPRTVPGAEEVPDSSIRGARLPPDRENRRRQAAQTRPLLRGALSAPRSPGRGEDAHMARRISA